MPSALVAQPSTAALPHASLHYILHLTARLRAYTTTHLLRARTAAHTHVCPTTHHTTYHLPHAAALLPLRHPRFTHFHLPSLRSVTYTGLRTALCCRLLPLLLGFCVVGRSIPPPRGLLQRCALRYFRRVTYAWWTPPPIRPVYGWGYSKPVICGGEDNTM